MKKRQRKCAYCGRISHDWDEDHVVPQCLYGDRRIPHNALKVVACLACNNGFSAVEGYFRSTLAFQVGDGGHPIVKQMLAGKAMNHWQSDQKFRRSIVDGLAVEPRFTPGGLFVRQQPTFPMDWDQWCRAVGKVVRGMYYVERKRRVPDSHVVYVWRGQDFWIDLQARRIVDQMDGEFQGFGRVEDDNEGVCIVKRSPSADDPDSMVYLLVFYEVVSVFATVIPRSMSGWPDPSDPVLVAQDVKARREAKQAKKKLP
jgi:hypothetical protein